MPVALPERTVDAWVTAYITSRIPTALIWAPTQRQLPDFDITSELPGPGKLLVLEDKAPYTGYRGTYGFTLGVRQMWNYLRNPELRDRTFYVLPCPPFPVTEVPGTRGAPIPGTSPMPRRAQARLGGHPWASAKPCEHWFQVVPALDLWTHLLSIPAPTPGVAPWPAPRKGSPPAGAPAVQDPNLVCPLPAGLGESLKTFMDRLERCDWPELRVQPESPREVVSERGPGGDSVLYQALITFTPAADLPGWREP